MDPFTGLGSTAVACARLGVNFVGSEIDETYLDEAVERTTHAAERGRVLPVRGEARMKKATSAGPVPARRSSAAL
jgi:DNA modification methylase